MNCLAEISEEQICEIIVYISFFFTGLLFIGLAIPMVLKKIPPNQFYGWRTPKAFQTEEIWYEINHYTSRDLLIIGIIQIVFNCATLLLRFHDKQAVYNLLVPGNLLILVGGTIIMLIRGFHYLKKL